MGRASSTCSAAPGRSASRRSPGGPPGRRWWTPGSRSRGGTCASSAWRARAEVVRSDALRHLRRSRRRFDLIFCDPPYKLADRLEGELDSLIPGTARGGRTPDLRERRAPAARAVPASAGRATLRRHPDPDPPAGGESDERRACGDLPGDLRPGHLRAPGHHRQGGERLRPRPRRGRQPADSQSSRRCSPPRSERRSSSRRCRKRLGNVEVEVFSILLVDFAREHGAGVIVKGLRAISDFEYEFEMNQLNRKPGAGDRVRLHHRLARLQLPLLDAASRRWRPSAATSPTWSRPRSPRRWSSA